MTDLRRAMADCAHRTERRFGIAGPGGLAVDKPRMPHAGRVGIGLLAMALGCLAGSVWAADAPARHVLSYRNDHLSLRVAGAPLEQIVAEIGEASGAHVSGALRAPRDVSAEFDDVPPEEALHRLLGDQNFVLKYGRDDHLRTIKLLGGPQAPI